MAYLLCCFTLCSLGALALGVLTLLFPRCSEDAAVALPRFFLIFGLFGDALFLVLIGTAPWTHCSLGLTLVFSLFAALNSSLILAARNIRILYDGDGFVSYNFWGLRRRYAYGDITGISGGTNQDVILWVGRRTVRIDEYAVGRSAFLAQAKKQYRIRHNGNAIPAKRPKWDVCNGNLENPGTVLVTHGMLILLCLGMMISLPIFCSNYIANLSLVSETVTFSRCEANRSDLRLYTDSSVIAYQISNYRKKMEDPALFLARCGADQRFRVQYAVHGKEDSVYYGLWSISGEDGTDYLTLTESRIHLRRNFLGGQCHFGRSPSGFGLPPGHVHSRWPPPGALLPPLCAVFHQYRLPPHEKIQTVEIAPAGPITHKFHSCS